jgi:hypothetical protein
MQHLRPVDRLVVDVALDNMALQEQLPENLRSKLWPSRHWATTPTGLATRITRALSPCGAFRCAESVAGHCRCVHACSLAPWEARF